MTNFERARMVAALMLAAGCSSGSSAPGGTGGSTGGSAGSGAAGGSGGSGGSSGSSAGGLGGGHSGTGGTGGTGGSAGVTADTKNCTTSDECPGGTCRDPYCQHRRLHQDEPDRRVCLSDPRGHRVSRARRSTNVARRRTARAASVFFFHRIPRAPIPIRPLRTTCAPAAAARVARPTAPNTAFRQERGATRKRSACTGGVSRTIPASSSNRAASVYPVFDAWRQGFVNRLCAPRHRLSEAR